MRRKDIAALPVGLLLGLTVPSAAHAEGSDGGSATITPAEPPPVDVGQDRYQGVAPGLPNLPPRPPALPTKGPVRVTWPGFQVKDGVPTVFVEVSAPVEWTTVADEPGKLVYRLKGASVPIRNNRRPLDATSFKTAVHDVSLKQHGRDVDVVIHLGQKAPHHEKLEDAAGGFKLLVIQIG